MPRGLLTAAAVALALVLGAAALLLAHQLLTERRLQQIVLLSSGRLELVLVEPPWGTSHQELVLRDVDDHVLATYFIDGAGLIDDASERTTLLTIERLTHVELVALETSSLRERASWELPLARDRIVTLGDGAAFAFWFPPSGPPSYAAYDFATGAQWMSGLPDFSTPIARGGRLFATRSNGVPADEITLHGPVRWTPDEAVDGCVFEGGVVYRVSDRLFVRREAASEPRELVTGPEGAPASGGIVESCWLLEDIVFVSLRHPLRTPRDDPHAEPWPPATDELVLVRGTERSLARRFTLMAFDAATDALRYRLVGRSAEPRPDGPGRMQVDGVGSFDLHTGERIESSR